MRIEDLPELLRPVHAGLTYLGSETIKGQIHLSFAYPDGVLVACWVHNTWFVQLGSYSWTMSRNQPTTPDGFLAELDQAFGRRAFQILDLLRDAVTWWIPQGAGETWRLYKGPNRWITSVQHPEARWTRIHSQNVPKVLTDPLNTRPYILRPFLSEGAQEIWMQPLTALHGGLSVSMHARLQLWPRIQEAAAALNLPDFVEGLRVACSPSA